MKKTVIMLAAFCLLAGGAVLCQAGDLSKTLHENHKAGKPVPLPSKELGSLNLDQAYDLQGDFMGHYLARGEKASGYKAGLTSSPAQKKFKAPGPVSGVLLESMLMSEIVEVDLFTKAFLEVEIGFRMAKDVCAPTTPDAVKGLVKEIMPVIEVPDMNFATMKGLTFEDIAAVNVGARGYILGEPVSAGKVDPNKVTGQLFYNDKPLIKPIPGRAAMGDQWKALSWTINNALKNGGKVKAGMVIITGSLGPMFPAKPGSYRAAYTGGLSDINFTVK